MAVAVAVAVAVAGIAGCMRGPAAFAVGIRSSLCRLLLGPVRARRLIQEFFRHSKFHLRASSCVNIKKTTGNSKTTELGSLNETLAAS